MEERERGEGGGDEHIKIYLHLQLQLPVALLLLVLSGLSHIGLLHNLSQIRIVHLQAIHLPGEGESF